MDEILEYMGKIGIVPVIRIEDPHVAPPLAESLAMGGVPCVEIAFRTEGAAKSIKLINRDTQDILVGAGTILSTAQADEALAAGAQFLVSPGFSPAIAKHCAAKKIPYIPGCATPTEMMLAIEAGLEVVKFFPAEQSGGLPFLRAVSAPFPNLRFLPTGGVSGDNVGMYAAFAKTFACGGSWMAPPELIEGCYFDEIAHRTHEALKAVKTARAGRARSGFRVV